LQQRTVSSALPLVACCALNASLQRVRNAVRMQEYAPRVARVGCALVESSRIDRESSSASARSAACACCTSFMCSDASTCIALSSGDVALIILQSSNRQCSGGQMQRCRRVMCGALLGVTTDCVVSSDAMFNASVKSTVGGDDVDGRGGGGIDAMVGVCVLNQCSRTVFACAALEFASRDQRKPTHAF
jgi:hypothetical protein